MNSLIQLLCFLCVISFSDASYGIPSQETQSDVEAPAYVPSYLKNQRFSKTGYSKTYSGTKTAGAKTYGTKTYGTKTGYGTKSVYNSGTKSSYGTKTGSGGYAESKSWHSSSGSMPSYTDFHGNANEVYTAKCEPNCKNNGICLDTNTCHCPANFGGKYCEFEKKPCLSYPPLPMNSMRKCSSEMCTITCKEGYKFIDGTTVANMRCLDGQWQPTRADFTSIPDCEPECDPPCRNGGVCLSLNTCQCPAEYRGPQCQYAANACDVRKLSFNGGYNCFGDGDSFSCKLNCPHGSTYSSPPASVYTCTYDTGLFQPQPIPHCVFSEVVVVTPSNYYSSASYFYSNHSSGFDQQSQSQSQFDFEQQSQNVEHTLKEFNHSSSQSKLTEGGFDGQRSVKIVVQDFTPKGGVCLTWAGVHYKTFDGKIFSFQSVCQHVLLREQKEHKYTIALKQGDCKRKAYCPSELTVYLEDKPYTLGVGEDGSVLFHSTKRLIPIPASLPGIRVTVPNEYVVINLDSAGVTIHWDTNNLIIIEGTILVWNNTEGLCSTLDGNPENDFVTKEGISAQTTSVLASSWQINKIGDECDSKTSESSACTSMQDDDLKNAMKFCNKIFSKEKFRKCSKVMDVTQLVETCQWDYCACASSQSAEECACHTVSVYAKECLRHGVEEMKNWRDSNTCPMQCPEGKIYNACGSDTQPSCAFPLASTKSFNTTCVEGCFCPEGLLLEGGKCVAKNECPCRLRNKNFKPGSVVPKECNMCTCQAGEWACTSVACGARCSAVGDPHYTTFDGLRYDFMGHCTYTMLDATNITVEVENVACDGAITAAMNLVPYQGEGKPSCTKAVNLRYNGVSIHLKQGGFILINGKEVSSLPVLVGDVKVRTASSLFLIVQLPNKVDLWWDGNTRVFIDVPPEFHQKTKGLCGTFNLNQKDDFLTPEGDIEQNTHSFANKWKTREICEDVANDEPAHPCAVNVQNKGQAETYCSKLKSKLFEECHWHVDVQPYYESCLYDMCACAGDAARCLCPALGDYGMACARAGLRVQWRYNVKECELPCSGGQEYTVCADSCVRTCADVAAVVTDVCKPSCVEGCACPHGQVLDGNNVCVLTGQCPCYHKGMQFEAGYKEVRAGRRERELCTCVGARWECTPATPADISKYPPAEDLRSNCSAANHMDFTSCATAEPLTCKNMHLPPSTTSSECRPGCQCKRGYVLESSSKKCVKADQCPCHHGGRSYPDGHNMTEECNTCECKSGNWTCSTRKCAGTCSAWGDSHLTTFDGAEYDFEGVCTYLLAKGAADKGHGFDVEIQNVPCGTTGATCSKSVTLKVSSGTDEEAVSLIRNTPLPDVSKLKRIELRLAGAYVFLDVPTLGMSLQWDRGMRVYVKVESMWHGRVKGLCGNFNYDTRDDFQTPGGGIPESSALIFADSWKLKTKCPKPQPVTDHCQQRPERKDWAVTACAALKRHPFTLCHSEAPPTPYIERCEKDACACDSGADCECACTALAQYAHVCANRGVTFKWRTQETCPMQCDASCSNYEACVPACPPETCDNTVRYGEVKAVCDKQVCVEGCKPKESCLEGFVYTNNTFTECVPRSKCRPACLTLDSGREILEGEVTEEDACHTCRCSKKHIVCTGQPCSTEPEPRAYTTHQTEKPHDEPLKCVTGWTNWINRGPPETGPNGESIDKEPLPKLNEMQIGSPMCKPEMMKKIECRTTVNHKTAKETGLNAECSFEQGLVCKERGNLCPDFEIRVYCECEEEPFQCLNSTHPNHPHPTDCSQFYECTPDALNPDKPHTVLKSCPAGLMYHPTLMICDWPASVLAVKPECGTTTVTESEDFTTYNDLTAPAKCSPGQLYKQCAYPCDKLCDHYKKTLMARGECTAGQKCIEGCVDDSVANMTCSSGSLWRDEKKCVPLKDCTCYSDGNIVKPGGVVTDGCIKCQCLDNQLHCDNSECVSIVVPLEGSTHLPLMSPEAQVTRAPTTETPTTRTPETEATPIVDTATPPPECVPGRYKDLLWGDEPLPESAFSASSVASALFEPQYAVLNGHPMDITAGSWNPKTHDSAQYIQVTFPRPEPIYGLLLQGSPLFDQYVTSYQILYGDNDRVFHTFKTADGKPKVFRGPMDHENPMRQMFDRPIEAKVFRIKPLTWHEEIAVRFELIGCGKATVDTTPNPMQCDEPLGLGADLPIDNIEVSSNNDLRGNLLLDSKRGWKPAFSTPGEWIMFDFTAPRNITGVKTKGGGTGWVTSYNIMYSTDLTTFNPVIDHNGYKEFAANFDTDTVVRNEFRPPLHARYLKVLPLKWKNETEMRIEPIGCFEAYVTTPRPVPDYTPAPLKECKLCPGVPVTSCECVTSPAAYYDGENCVPRDQCPCREMFMVYPVGSTFRGTNCDECVCKLGGITDCKPVKECICAPDLVPKLSKSACECSCEPCPHGTKICPTSKLCLPLDKWCDGLQDCPDDEKDCSTSVPTVMTTVEPTVVTTIAPTVAAVVTTEKPLECPKVECPPGYFVRYLSSSHSHTATSDLPPPRPRNTYTRYYKGGRVKNGAGGTKGGATKSGGAKGGFAPQPPSSSQGFSLAKPALNSFEPAKMECAQFKCVPNLPPPFKPGSRPAPVVCSTPYCPPQYTLKLDTVATAGECPQYICEPPIERPVYCNVTGRTFNTFDGAEYKYDVCYHILARENRFDSWSVLIRKKCRMDSGCQNELIVHQDDQFILVKPNFLIEYDNYEYTVEQTSKICFQKNSFDVSQIGNALAVRSNKYNFTVLYNAYGDVKIGVFRNFMGSVDGLCGAFDGNSANDRQLPGGELATSIDEFGRAWAKPGLSPTACHVKLIPPEKQKRAWDLCDVIVKEPISKCGKVLNLDKWRSICLEKICECEDLVVNGTKRTGELCRCVVLDQLVAECLAADKDIDLDGWRVQRDCPSDCPAPLVHYDCYRKTCEPQCADIASVRRTCPAADGHCFPGCYCPQGKLRRGDKCVAPSDCLDCICTGVGAPAKYVTFEGDDLPYMGNCTYLASRDRNETGIHKYEVYATNGACEDGGSSTCTKVVHLMYEKNIIHVSNDPISKKLVTILNEKRVFKYPLKEDWITITQNGQDVTISLPDVHVELTVLQSKLEFTVRVPSHLYGNQTEGLCGVCAGYMEYLVTATGKATVDVDEYGKSWQAPPTTISQLGVPPQEQCGEVPPPPQCKAPPPEHNPCYNLLNADRFGACHPLVDPQSYVESCQLELCENSTDICSVLERYAAECRRQRVCLDWRKGLCPYPCEKPLEYRQCVSCEGTCDDYEQLKENPQVCDKPFVEGCFCPEGKVRVNNTCIKPNKCFPCDVNKEHYVGDEWQEDACTKCSCSKLSGEVAAHVSCVTHSCVVPICSTHEEMVTEPAPAQCCPKYSCVPKPHDNPNCEEPKKMECGYGQVLKQKTTHNGCTEYACECKPTSECERIPSENEVELLEPGMRRVIDNSGCCPRVSMVCEVALCPAPVDCPQYQERVKIDSDKCCPLYKCEMPMDKCIVTLEWEAAPKGGEKSRAFPEVMLKDLDSLWLDGPCRSCRCLPSPRGPPSPSCSVTECPPLPLSDQFVMEPRNVPFACCPQAAPISCRDNQAIYRVGENWTSPYDPCESYQCVELEEGKLDRVTTRQTCHDDCDPGWQYIPAEPYGGRCCGKCKPVSCVVDGAQHKIGEHWTSHDHCTNYTCVDVNGTLQVQSWDEHCPLISDAVKKQFVMTEDKVPGKCCPVQKSIACRVGNDIYQEGQSWSSSDPCTKFSCARDVTGRLTHKESVESCARDCPLGQLYKEPSAGCCGRCVQSLCVVGEELKEPGRTWKSEDNCTTYSCDRIGDDVSVSATKQSCPDVSRCAPHLLMNETCCRVCRQESAALSTCVPVPVSGAESVGLIRTHVGGHGLCRNKRPLEGFRECRGTCDSHTLYNNQTGSHDSSCSCCQAVKYSPLVVQLTCEDGSLQPHRVAAVHTCACARCGGNTGLWPTDAPKSYTITTDADEIPEIYQRIGGASRAPRKG